MTAAVAGVSARGEIERYRRRCTYRLEAIPGRFERVVEGLPYDVIVDYAHTPDGLRKITHRSTRNHEKSRHFGIWCDRGP